MRKTALVTGGSRGIGRAICVKLAESGSDIVFNYQSGSAAAEETKKLCEEAGSRVLAVCADIKDSNACDKLVEEAKAFGEGRVDVLVNNAGITRDSLILRMKNEDLDAVLDVNLKGSFYMMRSMAKVMMKQRQGSIINMSSVVGVSGNAGQVNYSASKAAVIGMTKSLAKELASRNITVNAVAPGMIETEMTEVLPEETKKKIVSQIPLSRMGSTKDIANTVAFLASEEARYITGQVICVDGGMTI